MAAIDGFLVAESLGGHDNAANLTALDLYDPALYLDFQTVIGYDATPAAILGQTVYSLGSQPAFAVNGFLVNSFEADYYDRIHIAPDLFNVGALLTAQQRDFTVWNAYRVPKTLTSITGQSVEGIALFDSDPPPTTFAATEERSYSLTVDPEGPPQIDGRYLFDFAGESVDSIIRIIGQRVAIFPFIPTPDFTETLEWLTEIASTRLGEQRMAMRDAPRQFFDLRCYLDNRSQSQFKVLAKAWAHNQFGVPAWIEHTKGVTVASGASTIYVDTTIADYRPGGLAIIWESVDRHEAVEIDQVYADRITLARTTLASYASAIVAPVVFSVAIDGLNLDRIDRMNAFGSVKFMAMQNEAYHLTPSTIYKGRDVLTDENCIVGSITERLYRPVIEVDNGQGPVIIDTAQDYTGHSQTLGRIATDRAAIWALRRWLHYRQGKQKSFWLPSNNHDIRVTGQVTEFQTTLDTENVGLGIYGEFPISIRIQSVHGTFYRDITAASASAITIDSAIGEHAVDDFILIDFMTLVRFNSDRITINYEAGRVAKTTIPLMSVNDAI